MVAVGLAQMKVLDHGAGDAGDGLVVQEVDQRVDENECDRVERRDQDAVERDQLQAPALACADERPRAADPMDQLGASCERSSWAVRRSRTGLACLRRWAILRVRESRFSAISRRSSADDPFGRNAGGRFLVASVHGPFPGDRWQRPE